MFRCTTAGLCASIVGGIMAWTVYVTLVEFVEWSKHEKFPVSDSSILFKFKMWLWTLWCTSFSTELDSIGWEADAISYLKKEDGGLLSHKIEGAVTHLLSTFVTLTPSLSHETAPVTLQASEMSVVTAAVTRISSENTQKKGLQKVPFSASISYRDYRFVFAPLKSAAAHPKLLGRWILGLAQPPNASAPIGAYLFHSLWPSPCPNTPK